jgi:hypothetical protein
LGKRLNLPALSKLTAEKESETPLLPEFGMDGSSKRLEASFISLQGTINRCWGITGEQDTEKKLQQQQ